MSLFQYLKASFWKNPSWQEFQKQVEADATDILKYSEYLASQNKLMKEIHSCSIPVQQL